MPFAVLQSFLREKVNKCAGQLIQAFYFIIVDANVLSDDSKVEPLIAKFILNYFSLSYYRLMERPKKFSRDEVLEKAIPLFWERGFADIGLQEIEAAAGVNKSGLYSEFKGKEDIYFSSLRYYVDNRKKRRLNDRTELKIRKIKSTRSQNRRLYQSTQIALNLFA